MIDKNLLFVPVFLLLFILAFQQGLPAQNQDDPIRQQVEQLLSEMTLEEKVGEMTQLTIDMILVGRPYSPARPARIDTAKLSKVVIDYHVGSILNTPSGILLDLDEWRVIMDAIDRANQKTRLKIPILYGFDAIHGANYVKGATLFPQPLATASSWNLELAKEAASIAAYESRAAGISWNFSPTMDVTRNPVWPRTWESFGEDVFTNAAFGKAVTQGYQGNDISNKYKMVACLKHFAGYGTALSGKDRTPSWIPDHYMKEYFLPAYGKSIDAGALTVMINSGEINGTPVHASKKILVDMLRDELGFTGLAVSDWGDIEYLYSRHKVAKSYKEAIKIAINAGIDMSMVPADFRFSEYLVELVKEGEVSMSRIDEAVSRILTVKYKLGLFEHFTYPLRDYTDFNSVAFIEKSLQAAQESVILLKNEEDILPFEDEVNLAIIGPAANSMRTHHGGWSYTWQGDQADQWAADKETIYEAIAEHLNGKVHFAQGVDFDGNESIQEAVEVAQKADVILLCLGEGSYTEDWGNTNDLNLDTSQLKLTQAMIELDKPIVLSMTQGRPRIIRTIEPHAQGILATFYGGPEGGRAIRDVLFGKVNPSAKLPITYPKYPNNLVPYDHKYSEARNVQVAGLSFDPQFEFGAGLSYTDFEYSNLKVKNQNENSLEIEVTAKNTGDQSGKEVVHVYVSDLVASITPPVKRLRAFDKITLRPGQEEIVRFSIPFSELAFVNAEGEWIVEPGKFKVTVGGLGQTIDYLVKP